MVTITSFKLKQRKIFFNSKASFNSNNLRNTSSQPPSHLRFTPDQFDIDADEQSIPTRTMLQLAKNIIPKVLPWIALYSGYGFLVSVLNYQMLLPKLVYSGAFFDTVVALGIALSLLLALRSSIAYRRFRAGRKLLSTTIDVIHNTVRGIWLYVNEQEPQERYEKESVMQLTSAFAVAMKLHLRQQPMTELKPLVSQLEYKRLEVSHHAPLDITLWISDYLQRQYEQEQVDMFQLSYLRSCINEMVNIVGDCEQVLKMPAPLISSRVLKILSLVYSIVFPLAIVSGLGWMTFLATALVSSICLALNQTLTEIGSPFGNHHSDSYLNYICDTVKDDTDYLMEQTYCSQPKIIINLPEKTA